MSKVHATESDMLEFAGYKMRVPEAAILLRHLRMCPGCNERYRAIAVHFLNATRIDLATVSISNAA